MAEKIIKHQKGLTVYNLNDIIELEAVTKGKIFYQAWQDFHQAKIEKNRKILQKKLDKRLKK